MNLLVRIFKFSTYTLLGLFVAFVVYANWEEPPLHARVKPIAMTILAVNTIANAPQADRLREQVSSLEGVTACAANAESKLVSITYHADEISEETLKSKLTTWANTAVTNAKFAEVEGPECPVPHGYIMAFEKAKYAFCFR